MQFYDNTNKRAICQAIDRLCDSNDTAYPRLDKTAEVNDALEEIVGAIIANHGNAWMEWDDTNQTDLPVGTGTLVEGQEKYSFASEYLRIKRIKVADINGKWHTLKQIDQQIFDNPGVGYGPVHGISQGHGHGRRIAIEQWFGTDASGNPNTGLTEFYDILGDTISLYPAPSADSMTLTGGAAGGIKIHFVRTSTFFTPASDTSADTKEPGLPSPYHKLLVYRAALNYCVRYKKDRVAWLEKQWDEGMEKLLAELSKRNPDHRQIMTPRRIGHI